MTAQASAIERPPARLKGWRERSVLPGFPLALGVTLAWLGAIVLLPLTALALRPWELGAQGVSSSWGLGAASPKISRELATTT